MKLFRWSFFTPKPVFKPTIEKLITGLQDGSVTLESEGTSLEPGSDSLQPGQQVQLFQHVLDPESNHPLADEVVLEEVVVPKSSVKPVVGQRVYTRSILLGTKEPINLEEEGKRPVLLDVILGDQIGGYIPGRGPIERDGRNYLLLSKEKVDKKSKKLNAKTDEINLDITDANISILWKFVGQEDILQVTKNGNLELKPGASIWVTFEADKKGQEGNKVPKLIKDISTVKPEGGNLAVELFVPPDENMLELKDRSRARLLLPPKFEDSLGYFNWLLVNFMTKPQAVEADSQESSQQTS